MQLRGFNLTIPEMAMVCLFVCRFVQISFNKGCYKRAGAKDDGIKQFFQQQWEEASDHQG